MPEANAAPIAAIDFQTGSGYIAITRADGAEHGMYSTRQHAQQLAETHGVPLTVDGQPTTP